MMQNIPASFEYYETVFDSREKRNDKLLMRVIFTLGAVAATISLGHAWAVFGSNGLQGAAALWVGTLVLSSLVYAAKFEKIDTLVRTNRDLAERMSYGAIFSSMLFGFVCLVQVLPQYAVELPFHPALPTAISAVLAAVAIATGKATRNS